MVRGTDVETEQRRDSVPLQRSDNFGERRGIVDRGNAAIQRGERCQSSCTWHVREAGSVVGADQFAQRVSRESRGSESERVEQLPHRGHVAVPERAQLSPFVLAGRNPGRIQPVAVRVAKKSLQGAQVVSRWARFTARGRATGWP